MKTFFIKALRFYQRKISPLFPARCRYYPTCSQYALEALEVHGLFKGSLLAIGRLMRCNIFFPGGVDPVPPKKEK
ncbi:MAG: membrane protein insertion efficiency factor YidD [Acutalibacteraceae bacterium]